MRPHAIVTVMVFLFVSIVGAGSPVTAGQAPAATPAPGARPPAQAERPPQPSAPVSDGYTYQPDGRRDPFLNLLASGLDSSAGATKGDGPASMMVAEISVRGIMQSRGALVAMVSGPDKKTYIVRTGDRFLDGKVKSVTPQGLVIIQEVNDPLSLVKQREIRKLLRSLEDGKA